MTKKILQGLLILIGFLFCCAFGLAFGLIFDPNLQG